MHYQRCTKGKRACPPEDCGSPWGCAELILLRSSKPRNTKNMRNCWNGQIGTSILAGRLAQVLRVGVWPWLYPALGHQL